jgi:murein DD-endopeptidase MepM/ murein hydrolase activator NlpD
VPWWLVTVRRHRRKFVIAALVQACLSPFLLAVLIVTLDDSSSGSASGVCGQAPASDVAPVVVDAGSGPGPGGISAEDWAKVQTYANAKQIDPLVLVAIGKQETNWGQAGDGRLGNVLGVGSYDSGSTYKYAGIDGQLGEGSRLLASWGVHTIGDITAGKATDWATDPGWESGVAQWYGRLGGTGQAAATVAAPVSCDTAVSAAAAGGAVAWAMARLGTPYQFGGSGPIGPWDCSGFTQAAYASVGVALARDTYGQATQGVAVSRDQVQPGDLWLPNPGHVELVISTTQAVESPQTGDAVKVSPLRQTGVFRRVVTANDSTAAVNGLALPLPRDLLSADILSRPHHDHPALDIAVPTGTPIYAAKAGTVVTAGGADEGWGTHMVVIRDGEGWGWLYGHGSAVSVVVGQHVEAGQQVGSSGNEGFSTGPHLHVQVTAPGVAPDQTKDVHCPQAELVAAFNSQPGPPMSSLSQSCVGGHL